MTIPYHNFRLTEFRKGKIRFNLLISSDINLLCMTFNHNVYLGLTFLYQPFHYNRGTTSIIQ